MKRRDFIKGSAVLLAAAGTGDLLHAIEPSEAAEEIKEEIEEVPSDGPLIASEPVLQNFAETSIGIAFAVSSLSSGYVLIGREPDLSDARKVKCGGLRLTEISDKLSQIRLTGLEPSTRYYYRIGADRIHYGGGYDMKNLGSEESEKVYSFVTAGKDTAAHFCVINDTHVKWPTIVKCMEKIRSVQPSCVIWNGDASNTEETIEKQMRIFLKPQEGPKDYAAEIPYLFSPGNHDYRGMANRHLERVWMYRQAEERSSRDWDLGRNYAVRLGDVALIGLDTGEDKLDSNPLFAGIFNMKAYREAQTLWLRDALKRKDIARAKFKVAFCHIPLFDPRPDANPGDVAPDDKDPRYKKGYAAWQRTCASMWGPLLNKAGCQLVICGHQHNYRYDAPDSSRKWAQIVGGGPKLAEKGFPTVIEGEVTGGKLLITVHNMFTGEVEARHSFKA
ncbi:MAG: metallophosphoesterase [Bacteroidales bacterium]|nr:metallophosphoesterase [Bacteroidales bacterium]